LRIKPDCFPFDPATKIRDLKIYDAGFQRLSVQDSDKKTRMKTSRLILNKEPIEMILFHSGKLSVMLSP
jgi:hypothetical protein